jgi:hypothetical protein
MVHGLSGNYFFIIHMNDKHLVLIRKFIIVFESCETHFGTYYTNPTNGCSLCLLWR